MRIHIFWILLVSFFCFGTCGKKSAPTNNETGNDTTKTFQNPLLNGSDPWVLQDDTNYYYLQTLATRIAIWKSSKMSRLASVNAKTIFTPPGGDHSRNIWAPEIHRINNKWYIYYSAGSGEDSTQRTWVLENSGDDPTQDTWIDKGRIYNSNANFWAIDGTVFEQGGNNYFLWSGRPDITKQNQNIYISKMSDPWTLTGPVLKLTQPEYLWEINGPVNEGPQIIKNENGKVFLVYSASGCWTDDYCLGMMTLKEGGDPMNISDWTKKSTPVFVKQPGNNAFGPGHNSFFKSADGKEDWIIYHANTTSGDGCGPKRNIRMQKFGWNENKEPVFGEPVKTGTNIIAPSGE